jgi:hypothetical protein
MSTVCAVGYDRFDGGFGRGLLLPHATGMFVVLLSLSLSAPAQVGYTASRGVAGLVSIRLGRSTTAVAVVSSRTR